MKKLKIKFNKNIVSEVHRYGEKTGGTYTLVCPTVSITEKCGRISGQIDIAWPHTACGNAHNLCFSVDHTKYILSTLNNREALKAVLEDYFSALKYSYVIDKLKVPEDSHAISSDYFVCKIRGDIFKRSSMSHCNDVHMNFAGKIPIEATSFNSLKRCNYCGQFSFRFKNVCCKCNREFPK